MIRIFILSIIIMLLSGPTLAEVVSFDMTVTVEHPFTVSSVVTPELGTLNIGQSAGSVTVDASTIVPISAPTVTGALPNFTTGTISTGGLPYNMVSEKTAVVYIQSLTDDYDIAVALSGTPTLDIALGANTTPIPVVSITSNVIAFNALPSTIGNYVSLCIGPVLSIPSNAKSGTYTGTVTVDISAL